VHSFLADTSSLHRPTTKALNNPVQTREFRLMPRVCFVLPQAVLNVIYSLIYWLNAKDCVSVL